MGSELTGDALAPERSERRILLGRSGDERVARLVAQGDERACTILYRRYHQPLYRYCRSIVHNDADAQDALQSTFMAAFAALRREARDAPLRPWLFRIAHNETISLLRRRRPSADLSEEQEALQGSTEERIEQRFRLRQLVADLQALPDRQRSALVMRELSGLSHEEIAIATGTSAAGAKRTIFDARQALAEYAEGRAMSCEEVRHKLSDGDRRLLRGRRLRAHLRDCNGCASFAADIDARGERLSALAPPLAPAAAAGLLASVCGGGTAAHGGAGFGTIAAGSAGKTFAAGVAGKAAAVAGVAVVAAAAAGATHVLSQAPGHPRDAAASRARASHGATRSDDSANTARHPDALGTATFPAPKSLGALAPEGLRTARSGAAHIGRARGRSGAAREHAGSRRGHRGRNDRLGAPGSRSSVRTARGKSNLSPRSETQAGTRAPNHVSSPRTRLGGIPVEGITRTPTEPASGSENGGASAQSPSGSSLQEPAHPKSTP